VHALRLPQRVRANAGRQRTFDAFGAERNASGESNFIAVQEVIIGGARGVQDGAVVPGGHLHGGTLNR